MSQKSQKSNAKCQFLEEKNKYKYPAAKREQSEESNADEKIIVKNTFQKEINDYDNFCSEGQLLENKKRYKDNFEHSEIVLVPIGYENNDMAYHLLDKQNKYTDDDEQSEVVLEPIEYENNDIANQLLDKQNKYASDDEQREEVLEPIEYENNDIPSQLIEKQNTYENNYEQSEVFLEPIGYENIDKTSKLLEKQNANKIIVVQDKLLKKHDVCDNIAAQKESVKHCQLLKETNTDENISAKKALSLEPKKYKNIWDESQELPNNNENTNVKFEFSLDLNTEANIALKTEPNEVMIIQENIPVNEFLQTSNKHENNTTKNQFPKMLNISERAAAKCKFFDDSDKSEISKVKAASPNKQNKHNNNDKQSDLVNQPNEKQKQSDFAEDPNKDGNIDYQSELVHEPKKIFSIVNIWKIANKNEILNTDLILTLLDIGYCNVKYKYKEGDNVRKEFWSNVFDEPVFKDIIFKNYKADTLRKYFHIIDKVSKDNKVQRYIEIIEEYKYFLDHPRIKLLTALRCISSFIENDKTNFKEYLENFINCVITDEHIDDQGKISFSFTTKKRKRSNDI